MKAREEALSQDVPLHGLLQLAEGEPRLECERPVERVHGECVVVIRAWRTRTEVLAVVGRRQRTLADYRAHLVGRPAIDGRGRGGDVCEHPVHKVARVRVDHG